MQFILIYSRDAHMERCYALLVLVRSIELAAIEQLLYGRYLP